MSRKKLFITTISVLFVFVVTCIAAQAVSLSVVGTGSTNFYVYDFDLNQVAYASTNGQIELLPGTYFVKLNNTIRTVTVVTGQDTVVKAGTVSVNGTGITNYYVYDSDMHQLAYASTNQQVELFPGTYTVKLNNTVKTANIQEGENSVVKAGTVSVNGTGITNYYVYNSDMHQLAYASTNGQIELFPGTYTVKLNDTVRTATIQEGKNMVVKAGTVSVNGTGSTNYYVYGFISNSINNGDINGDGKIGLDEAIYALQTVSGIIGTGLMKEFGTIGFYLQLAYTSSNRQIELFPGIYTLKLNETFRLATVQEGENTIIKAGTVSVAGTGSTNYYVYSSDLNQLAYASTNRQIELFPGIYTLKLNEIVRSATVQEGENTIIKAGTVSVAGTGSTNYYVYSSDLNQLAYASTNRQIELFPGNYTIKLDKTVKTATVQEGQNTSIAF